MSISMKSTKSQMYSEANAKRIALGVFLGIWFLVLYTITPAECLTAPGVTVPRHCVD